MFKKYRHKESGEVVEASKSINEFGKIEYCVYQEPAGNNFWGQDFLEKDFLDQYEPIE